MWNGKVVIITGASDGIGASRAKLIGQRGAKVTLTALPEDTEISMRMFHVNVFSALALTQLVGGKVSLTAHRGLVPARQDVSGRTTRGPLRE